MLLSFTEENIQSYLDRAFDICSKRNTWKEIKMYTVLHVCAAHVIKAVAQSVARTTQDKGLRQFAIFAFARLQNSTSLGTALTIFRSLRTVFIAKYSTERVQSHLKVVQDLVKGCKMPDIEQLVKLEDCPLLIEDDEEERINGRTIVGGSPFTRALKKVLEEVQDLEKNEADASPSHTPAEENAYFCPGIINLLFDNYLGIFPLWSGLLLGNLQRYAVDKEGLTFGPYKSRDTNCRVER